MRHTSLELTPDEVDLVLTARRAQASLVAEQLETYEIVRRQSLDDGLVEVEPGRFVRLGPEKR